MSAAIKIPKTIHIVWIGDESKIPSDCIKTWVDFNTTWIVKVWGNTEYYNYPWRNRAAMDSLWDDAKFDISRKSGIADIMRYEILYNEGGFCIDADSTCIKPLEDWLFDAEACASWENETTRPGLIAVGYMASIPNNLFFNRIIDEIYNDPDITDDLPWVKTGPLRLTDAYNSLKYNNLKIWPSHYFIPIHYTGISHTGNGPIFGVQEWMTTLASVRYY